MDSSIKYSDFSVVCRICLQIRTDMGPITSLNVVTMIEACSSVHISEDDGLPQNICALCIQRFHDAYELKELCEISDARLREIADEKNHVDDDKMILKVEIDDIERNLPNENSMFKTEVKTEYSEDNDSYPDSGNENDSSQMSDDNENKKNSRAYRRTRYPLSQYKCELCDKVLDGVWRLGLHMKRKHSASPISCDKCGQQFYHELHLEEHLNNHDESQLTCKECNKQFINLAKLKKHQVAHRPELFHCFKCDSSFKGKFMLNKHEQIYHSGNRPREECHICGKSVISTNMKVHMKIHQDRTPFSCNECPKKFVREITLREHVIKIHRKEEIPMKQLCNVCGRCFRGKSELRRHMRSHTGEKPFACNLCDKHYRESKALKRHILSAHMDERPFGCTVCSKAFHTKAILQAHMRTHTGERPYNCLVCNKSFGSKTWLKAHIKGHND